VTSLLSLITPIDDTADFFSQLLTVMNDADLDGSLCEWIIIHDGVRERDDFTAGLPLPDYAVWMKGDGHSATSAVNIGIKISSAPLLHFLMGDDLPVFPELIELAKSALAQDEPPDIVSGGVIFLGEIVSEEQSSKIHLPNLDWNSALMAPTYLDGRLFHRNLVERIGVFDYRFHASSDRDYMIRALQAGARHALLTDQTIYKYRIHPLSRSMGGNPRRISEAIMAHIQMAEEAYQRCDHDAPERDLLRSWQGYEVARFLYYSALAGDVFPAIRCAMRQTAKDPLWIARAISRYITGRNH